PSPSFYEPGGLSVASNKLYVADTNNHAIRVVDLTTRETSTLRIKGLEPPPAVLTAEADVGPNSEEIKLRQQRVPAQSKGTVVVEVELPPGFHLNPMALHRYRVSVEGGEKQLGLTSASPTGRDREVTKSAKDLRLPLQIPFQTYEPGTADLRIQLTFVYCREDNTGACHIKTFVWRAPVEVVAGESAASQIKISGKVSAD
ncbi:MAG: hypothetical protein ACREBC_15290, partial [Pyrinomonadaceae bacterium]